MLSIVLTIAFVIVIGLFITAILLSMLENQRSQRRRIGQLAGELEELRQRLLTTKEREEEAIHRRETEAHNQRLRELYEHGGC